jgi:hypothetical protein
MQSPHLEPDTRAPAWRGTPAALALAMALTLSIPFTAQAADAMRVVRDPVTGEMRGPTAAEAAAFERAAAQLRQASGKAPTGPTEIRYADGTIETKLGDDSMLYSVVRANEDGSLAMDCLPGKQVQSFHQSAAKAAKTGAKAVSTKTKARTAHVHQ